MIAVAASGTVAAAPAQPLLRVRNLSVHFPQADGGHITPVDRVSFDLARGGVMALVGESGSGKSLTLMALTRLIPGGRGLIEAEELSFDGEPVLALRPDGLRRLRGRDIGYVFQSPLHALNPLLSVGTQIAETMEVHMKLSRRAARAAAAELLARVGIPDPARRVHDMPHQFSGGMCQRVMIAMALAREPRLILADEPTTALDVTIQAQILELLRDLVRETGVSIVLVTHDLGVAASFCDSVHVMYAGQIVEAGPVEAVFGRSQMPYTWGLLDSISRFDREPPAVLPAIPGRPPNPSEFSHSCRFRPRCAHAAARCAGPGPELEPRGVPGQVARCWGTAPGGWLEGVR
jgi:oligopeptide/dipeptide ABC transporter ATP-binding protein